MISNRKMIDEGNMNVYGNELKFGYETNQMETGVVIPMYVPSGLMNTIPISRKRSRDFYSFDPSVSSSSFPNDQFINQIQFNGQETSMQIYEQQQLEIDRFISLQMEKMRSEIEASRKRITMRLIEEGMKRIRSKEEEIIKIVKLNYALEQKVKSLNVDNQIWQQMAVTNEATANVLRHNLQQIVTEIQQQQQQQQNPLQGDVEDGESWCGSNNEEGRRIVKSGDVEAYCREGGKGNSNGSGRKWWCRNCGKEERCVLLLPCRHLCVCSVCESSINVCPICKSTKNDSLHVNMNSF